MVLCKSCGQVFCGAYDQDQAIVTCSSYTTRDKLSEPPSLTKTNNSVVTANEIKFSGDAVEFSPLEIRDSGKQMFNRKYRYSEDATTLAKQVSDAIYPIFKQYLEKGYSPRDIDIVISNEVNDICLESILDIK